MRRSSLAQNSSRRITASFLFGVSLALTAGTGVFAKPSYTVSPPPPWIRTIEFAPGATSEPGANSSGSEFLLDDHQIRVGEKTVERYYHHVQKIDTAAGLDELSQLRFYFEPSFQSLNIHFIRIHRGATLIDGLKPAGIKVIQQEEELNQQLYNGTLAAVVFVHDLRVGDVVDYAYTVNGDNPVLGGRFTDRFAIGERQSIQHLMVRLLWPSSRALAIRNENTDLAPQISESAGNSEYVWEQHNTKPVVVDDDTPNWFSAYPSVSVSEFQSWAEVTGWAMPLYASGKLTSPELLMKIKQWQENLGTSEQRTVAALRFVQDEIRYLGIELGRYSHQPTAPDKVFARRFGDCKDKSFLLSTILMSMGIAAAPALVNATEGRALDNRQPTPLAFDHVIVQVKLNGKTYWLDPTISYQRGELDKYYDPAYERALVLRDGTAALEKIPLPAPGSGSIIVNEEYEGKKDQGPVALSVTTKYFGANADSLRYDLASVTLAELSKLYLNYYAAENPSIRADGLPVVADNQISNTIVVTEKYLIAEFWKDDKHRFMAEKIYAQAGKPDVSQRSMPLRVPYPLSIRQTIDLNLLGPYSIDDAHGAFSDEQLKFTYEYSRTEDRLRLEYSLDTFADSVPVAQIQRHLAVLDKVQDFVGLELPRRFGSVSSADDNPMLGLVVIGLLVVPFAIILTVVAIRRRGGERRRRQFAEALKSRAGFTPETAIGVSSEDGIDEVLRTFKCGCGEHPYRPESPPLRERFLFDGQRLFGLQLQCPDCGRKSDLYIKLTGLENAPA